MRVAVIAALSAAGVALAAAIGSGKHTSLCAPSALRVGHPHWVSPITQTDIDGIRVANVGRTSCILLGIPETIALGPGLPAVPAVPGAYGLSPPFGTDVTLRPHAAAIILVATSHACEPQPPQAYSAVAIALDGKTFVVRLPQREPDSPRTDLRLHVNRDCPPAVFAFLPAPS